MRFKKLKVFSAIVPALFLLVLFCEYISIPSFYTERPTVTSFFHTAALDDSIYECEAITFTCEVGASNPPVKSIYIYHEDRLVHRSLNVGRPRFANTLLAVGSRRGRLRIAKVKKEDEGRYYCVAGNEHGLGYNKTIDLKVFGKYSPVKQIFWHDVSKNLRFVLSKSIKRSTCHVIDT